VIRLAVRCNPELAERVLAELVELVPGGVEEERGRTYVEYAIYGEPGEMPTLPTLTAAAGDGLVEIETSEVPDDWGDRWRDFHRPIEIGDRLVVRPSWERTPEPADGRRAGALVEVVIDPGQAFGTGSHATTQMCLELLLGLADEDRSHGPLVDLGTGSGVLAIAGAKLGWQPVSGFDHEVAAVEAARGNAAINDAALEVRRLNLRDEGPPLASTVVANLTARLLETVAGAIGRSPGTVDQLVCSGLLQAEADDIASTFEAAGLEERKRLVDGDWAALRLEATTAP